MTTKQTRATPQQRTALQITSTSAKATFSVDDRPSIHQLNLAGPRRELEGRGGATATLDTFRFLIRYPGLPALAAATWPRTSGRPAAYPDVFWMFYLCAWRELASADRLDQELKNHWEEICKEFYFEHGVRLPARNPKDGTAMYASFNAWRRANLISRPGQVERLLERFTQVSNVLALAVRQAEAGGATRDLLTPGVWDCVAADGTVLRPPSEVYEEKLIDEQGEVVERTFRGSRATTGAPRVHEPVATINKPGAPKNGLFNVAVTTKGTGTYTRTVLSVDIGTATEGELPVAKRALTRLYDQVGATFPVLLYDGAVTPVTYQDFLADYGIYCVNANAARKKTKAEPPHTELDPASTLAGQGKRHYGVRRGEAKYTYATALDSITHEVNGHSHEHHLAADDGAVYEIDRPLVSGGNPARIAGLTRTKLDRLRDDTGQYYLRLTLSGNCTHGSDRADRAAGEVFEVTYELRKTPPNKLGHIPWRELIANIRVLPEALGQAYAEVYGKRNQVESFFDWLEQCYYREDRAASWGRSAQLLDLLGAATLHNAETWAHLAYRHPEHAAPLVDDLRDLPVPD